MFRLYFGFMDFPDFEAPSKSFLRSLSRFFYENDSNIDQAMDPYLNFKFSRKIKRGLTRTARNFLEGLRDKEEGCELIQLFSTILQSALTNLEMFPDDSQSDMIEIDHQIDLVREVREKHKRLQRTVLS